jgi:hypothetical protein
MPSLHLPRGTRARVSQSRELTSPARFQRNIREAISIFRRKQAETDLGDHQRDGDQRRSSIMSALLNLLYHEYCKARLAEIRVINKGERQ